MTRKIQLTLSPAEAADEAFILKRASADSGLDNIGKIRIIKKSIDARRRVIKVNISIEVVTDDSDDQYTVRPFKHKDVSNAPEVIIVGAGPAGLFAALRLIELGLRPVILERGRDVSTRKIDIARISREHIVDPDSNYCFGEGGAGTYSDGKLYTRSKKRGDNSRVLELLCLHGADQKIMYEAHPHLGTDKLPRIISKIRNTIKNSGGIFLLEKRVDDFIIDSGGIKGIITNRNETYRADNIILATGHSARDIYRICTDRGVILESKPYAMGVRVEHPQELIDRIQYHGTSRGNYLPAAEYSLVRQVDGRGVFSFCMCPGGFIVPSATSDKEVVVNGMSPSGRNSRFANAGIVVEVRDEDLIKYASYGVLAGLEYQKQLEYDAWINGGSTQRAPAQRLADFVSGKVSGSLPSVSYFPGVTSSPLHQWLPEPISRRLRQGFSLFGKMMNGFLTNDAVVLGVESRTSSPLRIPRNHDTLEHIAVSGLFPCGEGSGYAGGIVSSAVDGMRTAEAIALKMSGNITGPAPEF